MNMSAREGQSDDPGVPLIVRVPPLRMLVHATWASKLAAGASLLTLVMAIGLWAIWVDRRTLDGEVLAELRADFHHHVEQDNKTNADQRVLDQEVRDWMTMVARELKLARP